MGQGSVGKESSELAGPKKGRQERKHSFSGDREQQVFSAAGSPSLLLSAYNGHPGRKGGEGELGGLRPVSVAPD